MSFDDFRKQWKKGTKIKIADIQRAKQFSEDVKYVTKEDYRPIVYNVDWNQTYIAAQKFNRLNERTYPYIALNAFQKFVRKICCFEKANEITDFYKNVELRHWQKQLMRLIDFQT